MSLEPFAFVVIVVVAVVVAVGEPLSHSVIAIAEFDSAVAGMSGEVFCKSNDGTGVDHFFAVFGGT